MNKTYLLSHRPIFSLVKWITPNSRNLKHSVLSALLHTELIINPIYAVVLSLWDPYHWEIINSGLNLAMLQALRSQMNKWLLDSPSFWQPLLCGTIFFIHLMERLTMKKWGYCMMCCGILWRWFRMLEKHRQVLTVVEGMSVLDSHCFIVLRYFAG